MNYNRFVNYYRYISLLSATRLSSRLEKLEVFYKNSSSLIVRRNIKYKMFLILNLLAKNYCDKFCYIDSKDIVEIIEYQSLIRIGFKDD